MGPKGRDLNGTQEVSQQTDEPRYVYTDKHFLLELSPYLSYLCYL